MAKKKFTTSNDMHKLRVFGGKRGNRRIGRVKSCVFHPSEKRCIGFIIKRPDLLWMFRRKDLFLALDSFDMVDGHVLIKENAETTGPAACRRLGVNWDDCVLWEGMPLMTADGTAVGYVGTITFSLTTGEVREVVASNGVTAKYLLGTLTVPAEYILGFKRGMGAELAVRNDSREETTGEAFMGAILVSDDVWTLQPEGGWAEAAGEFTAKATARVKEKVAQYTPKVQEATHAAGEAINDGAYAVGKQVAATKGMFGAFKEEFDKAKNGEDETELAVTDDSEAAEPEPGDTEMSNMFSSFKEEFDKASGRDEAKRAKEAEDEPAESTVGGMFAAFREEFDKASKGDASDSADADADYDYDEDEDEYEEEAPAKPAKKASAKKTAAKKSSSSSVTGMFAAFKEEFDKASKGE
jgi:uncharacterized protein YrrD